MPQLETLSGSNHPSPQRDRVFAPYLWFSVIAAPLAWAARLLVNYAIAGQRCVGAANVELKTLSHSSFVTMLLIDLLAITVAAIAGYVAYLHWLQTRTDKAGGTHVLVHSGEGRTRFLAMCGMLSSTLFGIAVAMDAIGNALGPPC
jgi:hypothetical protein